MFKFAVVVLAMIACTAAKPGLTGAPLAYTAPAAVVAAPAPVLTASSSQFIARNHNGVASVPIVAPVAAVATQTIAAPLVAPSAFAGALPYASSLHYTAASAPILL